MSQPSPTDERMLKLRLAARALIEWKEPPTSPRYKQVVRELVSVHPFAARVGFDPDKPIFRHDTRGTVLWFLSETLDDTETAAHLTPSGYTGDETLEALRYYRSLLLDRMMYIHLDNRLDEKLGYGLTVRDMIIYIKGSLYGTPRTTLEVSLINYSLIRMIGGDKEATFETLKWMTGMGFNFVWEVKSGLGVSLLNFSTLNPVFFSLAGGVVLGVFVFVVVMRALALPTPALLAAGALFSMLIVETLTTGRIYHLFRKTFVNSKLLDRARRDNGEAAEEDLSLQLFARLLAARCIEDATFFKSLLKGERSGIHPGVVLSLLKSYPGEGVDAVTAWLGDPEISRRTRVEIFGWLCRIKTLPYDDDNLYNFWNTFGRV